MTSCCAREAFTLRGTLLLCLFGVSVLQDRLLALLIATKWGRATVPCRSNRSGRAAVRDPRRPRERHNVLVTGLLGGIGARSSALPWGAVAASYDAADIKGLIVTVIGGLGSIPGAIVAGLLVGAFENVFQQFRGVTERDLYVMLLLFAFLIFRPGGLFPPRH